MSDISGPITSADQIDELAWTQVSDQFGLTSLDASAGNYYSELTVETINGTTYVVGVQVQGSVDLWEYDSGNLTLLASHETLDARATFGHYHVTEPQIYEVDGKIVIVGNTQSSQYMAWSYDPALGPATVDDDNRLVLEEANFKLGEKQGTKSGDDDTFTFNHSNGETYFLSIGSGGAFEGGTLQFDANGDLTFDKHIDSTPGYRTFLLNNGFVTNEERATIYDERYNVLDTQYDSDTVQIGDVAYTYYGGADQHGTFHLVKWEVDPDTGQLNANQVIYTDGTTVKDLYDMGYTTQPFPATSPTTGALPMNSSNFPTGGILNEIALQNPDYDGTREITNDGDEEDALDFRQIRAIKVFEVGGEYYMFAGTYGGNQNGAGIFKIDPATGMPTELIDIVEGDIGSAQDADDAEFAFSDLFNDIIVTEVPETGEIIITANTNSALLHFGFDPNGGWGTGDTANTGALTYLGAEGGGNSQLAPEDTFGTNFLGANSGDSNTSGLNAFAMLPDGTWLVGNNDSLWLADPGTTDLTATPAICFVRGTKIQTIRGEVPVEELREGDEVLTRDNGYKEILWIGSRTIDDAQLRADEKLLPIRIRAGALGENYPSQDLYVSPQHRVVINSKIAQRMFNSSEVLVPAKKLLSFKGVNRINNCQEVSYYHILLDQHEIVYANGAEAETLFTGPEALQSVNREAREEILKIFPEFTENMISPPSVRPIAEGKALNNLLSRHKKNDLPLYF